MCSPLTSYQNALSDDQTNTTLDALDIVLLHDLAWVGAWGAIPGKRRHHESVLQGDTPDLERSEKSFGGHCKCVRKQVLSEKSDCWWPAIAIPRFYSRPVLECLVQEANNLSHISNLRSDVCKPGVSSKDSQRNHDDEISNDFSQF